MNYIALILPISFGYIANYYALKHEYKELKTEYTVLLWKYKRLLSENEEHNEQ
jgi:hypothetical protein